MDHRCQYLVKHHSRFLLGICSVSQMSMLEISEQVSLAKGTVLSLPLLPNVSLPPYFKALVCFHHIPISVSEQLPVPAFKSISARKACFKTHTCICRITFILFRKVISPYRYYYLYLYIIVHHQVLCFLLKYSSGLS